MTFASIRPEGERGRWGGLALIVAAQFMVILDVAIVNVALPSIKTDLHFSEANLQWVITAYAILFGGVLLLGGRLADLFGRRRLFVAGLGVFERSPHGIRGGGAGEHVPAEGPVGGVEGLVHEARLVPAGGPVSGRGERQRTVAVEKHDGTAPAVGEAHEIHQLTLALAGAGRAHDQA